MFDGKGKRFSAVLNKQFDRLVDAMSVRLNPTEALALADYGAYSFDEIVSPTKGENVTTHGFPGIKAVLMDASSFEADIAEVSGANFKVTKPSAKGYSGGPVTSSSGLVGIASGDVGHDGEMTNGLSVRLDLLKASLFQQPSNA